MHTIVFSCLKGGVGKSLHAAHLSVALEQMGFGSVVTMDLDPQGTHADWWNSREAETPHFAVVENHTQLKTKHAALKRAGYDWLVIDTPPQVAEINRAAIKLADLVIIPCKHSVGDIKATLPTVELCEQEGKKFYYLLNETNGKGVAQAAKNKLAEIGPVIPHTIPKLNGYWESLIPGKTITEVSSGTGAILIENVATFIVHKFKGAVRKEKAHV
ncbi:AAA family ATPase [Caballeronia sp. TF1N1]|uniref:division plane positioning ATPase MipZ n=1 Tax=Caballeronia sp. TF1N1 TaxID=2878153 RepID=UPI001FD482D0|nr:AAA family ATPase [Caballeronia sp. TF1N1]